jgi:O-methyltransferase involved in polyketide biosynthesis
MKRNYKTISPTAFNHIIFRTYYGIPLAEKFAKAAEKYSPLEHLFDRETIRNNSPIFEGRYKGGEKAIEKFVKKNPDCIVLELAAGFSLHGADLAKKYPKMEYIETDLPNIIRIKKEIMKKIGKVRENVSFKSANALDPAAVKKVVSHIPISKKIVVYCEGLLSYFNDEEKKKIAGIVHSILKKHGGAWIAPDPALDSEAREALLKILPAYRRAVKKAEKMAKQKYDDYGFKNEMDTDNLFRSCGFLVHKQGWPTKLRSLQSSGISIREKEALQKILKKFGKTWALSLR